MENIRNIAVIAHVDHGKTTLIDELLKQSHTFASHANINERMMDSDDLEKERGITILSKNTAIDYGDYRINIIDTPGHADFGGEVERVLSMVDGVLLLVDAQEGVMPQTKFVVKKMIDQKLKPIVVINKIDKPASEPDKVVDEIFDLFVAMGADEHQLEFKTLYAIARDGIVKDELEDDNKDLKPLFEAIINEVPHPKGSSSAPMQVQAFTLGYDNYVGKIAISRVFNGVIKKGMNVTLAKIDGEKITSKISKLFGFKGLERYEIDEASSGDIIALAGIEEISIGDTVLDSANLAEPLEPLIVEEPTLNVIFAVNDSPLSGTEGTQVTSNKIKERLEKEVKTNVAMRFEVAGEGKFKVSGRGELQITILAENLRREGFEFSISRPEVILKEIDGVKNEPYELLVVDIPDEFSGSTIEFLGRRKANMVNMNPMGVGYTRIEFEIPARGLIGFKNKFMTDTKGEGVANSSFLEFRPYSGKVEARSNGALVSMIDGVALAYSIFNLQDRGAMFIKPQDKIYEGMIVGEHTRTNDLTVNPIKGKNLTNVRSSGTDDAIKLVPPRVLELDTALEWINEDELVEITPKSIRLRKKLLTENQRKRAK